MKARLVGLDSLRGIAALALIVFHVRGIPMLECPLFFNKTIDHLGSGVPLFYAVSAFSLMLGYEARLLEVDGLSHFYIRRFFRIMPLFYTMLCFWLVVRAFYFHAPTSFSDITLNTSCLFGLLPQSHEGLVWASWSIGVEWIFYIFFPILMLMASTLMGATVLFIASIAISVASMTNLEALSSLFPSFGYMAFSTQIVFFTGGILAFKLGKKVLLKNPSYEYKKWLPTLLVLTAAVYLVLLWNSPLGQWVTNKHLGTQSIIGGWILLLMATLPGIKSILDHSFLQRAGKLSFSLYLLNPPIIFGLFKSGCYNDIYRFCGSPGMGFVVCLVLSLVCIWVVAETTFYFIEQPGISIGEMVSLHCSNNPREKLKIREKLEAHKIIKRSKIAIILSVFLLMPWIFWEVGEIKLHQQQKIPQKPTEVAATTPTSSNELNLSNVPDSYTTAKIALPGPWIESVSINKKTLAVNPKQTIINLHAGDIITLSGWSADTEHPLQAGATYIVLESFDETKRWMFPTHAIARKDVADFYHKKDLDFSGFALEGKMPEKLLGDQWSVTLFTEGGNGFIKAPTKYTLAGISAN